MPGLAHSALKEQIRSAITSNLPQKENRMANEKKAAEKRLDKLLKEAPDRQEQLLKESNFAGIAESIGSVEENTPATLTAAARTIRMKCGYIIIAAGGMSDEVKAAVQEYEKYPDADSLRVAHARLVIQQLDSRVSAARAMKRQMVAVIAQNAASASLEASANMAKAIHELKTWKGDDV